MIGDGHAAVEVGGFGLGVLYLDVEIAVIFEYAGVEQFELGLVWPSVGVFLHETPVGECRLRIAIQHAEVAAGRGGVEMPVILLDVLAVIALVAGESKQTFFEYGVLSVPDRDRMTEMLIAIGYAGYTVFTPAIGLAARVVVREILPRRTVRAVILANGAP